MATARLYNLARMTTATTGTGTITLGSAVSGFLTFAGAGVANAESVTYAIRDGANSEIGRGTYTAAGTTLTRSVLKSTNSDAAISLSGSAEVYITAAKEDYFSGPSSATDKAAARWDGSSGTTLDNSALLIANTTGALTRSGGGGIPVEGTNTNDSAAATYIGEYISSIIAVGSAVSLTTATPANVTSISLTAGDWDVSAVARFDGSGATVVQDLIGSVSTTSATLDSTAGRSCEIVYSTTASFAVFTNNRKPSAVLPTLRFSVSATTTLYLVANAVFATSTCTAFGILTARRAR